MAFGDFQFHGSFTSKKKARQKEKEVGGFIRTYRLHGVTRYSVVTSKKGRKRPRRSR